jgi:hypothetical protein
MFGAKKRSSLQLESFIAAAVFELLERPSSQVIDPISLYRLSGRFQSGIYF